MLDLTPAEITILRKLLATPSIGYNLTDARLILSIDNKLDAAAVEAELHDAVANAIA